jgi:hypothetical protein
MNSFGRTAAAVVVAAGLFSYIYFVESKKEVKTEDPGFAAPKREKVFKGFDKLKVKSISLKKKDGEIIHAERNGDAWAMLSPQEVPADSSAIGMLLDAAQNLESDEVVGENVTDLAAYGLSEPKVSVSLVAEGAQKPFEFDLGDSVPAGSGLFARVPGAPRLFTVSSMNENTFMKSAFELRDRSLVKVKKDSVRSVEAVERGKVSFKLVKGAKGDDDWKIEAPVKTRAGRWTVDGFLGLIENLRMESIVTEAAKPADLARFGLGAPARRVTFGLEDNRLVTLEIGKKTDDSKYYARDASSKLVATITTGVTDDLDKGLKNLRGSRLLDVATYDVKGLDVARPGASATFTKSTTRGKDGVDQVQWKSTAPAKDATQDKMSEALLAIGGLEATEYVDAPKAPAAYGLDAPALRVTLRFEGEKREDWFEIGLVGDAAFARRRDDDAVLKVGRAKAEALIKTFTALGS